MTNRRHEILAGGMRKKPSVDILRLGWICLLAVGDAATLHTYREDMDNWGYQE